LESQPNKASVVATMIVAPYHSGRLWRAVRTLEFLHLHLPGRMQSLAPGRQPQRGCVTKPPSGHSRQAKANSSAESAKQQSLGRKPQVGYAAKSAL